MEVLRFFFHNSLHQNNVTEHNHHMIARRLYYSPVNIKF